MPQAYFGQTFAQQEYRFEADNVQETMRIAGEFARFLTPGDVVGFVGEMGSGKTTFISGVCAGLRITDVPSSPTFTLIHEYQGGTMPVYHFDFYRVRGEDELWQLGLEEYFSGDGVCLIEWADKFPDSLPERRFEVDLHMDFGSHDQQRRHIRIVKR